MALKFQVPNICTLHGLDSLALKFQVPNSQLHWKEKGDPRGGTNCIASMGYWGQFYIGSATTPPDIKPNKIKHVCMGIGDFLKHRPDQGPWTSPWTSPRTGPRTGTEIMINWGLS